MLPRTLTRRRRGRVLPIVLVLAFLAMLAAGTIPRLARSKARNDERSLATATPTVFTESVRSDTGALGVDLPGSVQGLHETNIWARTNGFVKTLRVDIGSVVKKGDTLRVRCTWDNPTDNDVNWGEGTADEMCLGTMLFSY